VEQARPDGDDAVSTDTPTFALRDEAAHTPERDIANDLVKRGLMVLPALLLVFGLTHGVEGVLSSAYGLLLVLVNFAFAAFLLTTTARISLSLMMAAVLGGYVVRLGLITAAVIAVRDASWVELVPLGFTIIVAHLGLLLWETKYVSASLAFPGLKPKGTAS
jgi:hypothetical protein